MPANRYFIDEELLPNTLVRLDAGEWHHLVHVMRQKNGDAIELVNGRHQLATASIAELAKDNALLTVHNVTSAPAKAQKRILVQAFPKLAHLEFILEKGTELGATAFWLYPGIYSEKDSMRPAQLTKLRHWIISAMKQCGRLDLPALEILPELSKWQKPEGYLLFGDTRSQEVNTIPTEETILFFIGPERGFHPRELSLLESWGAHGISLHENILRVETAALVATYLMSH